MYMYEGAFTDWIGFAFVVVCKRNIYILLHGWWVITILISCEAHALIALSKNMCLIMDR